MPAFYTLLRAQDVNTQTESTERLQNHLTSLALAADEQARPLHAICSSPKQPLTRAQGPFFLGTTLSLVDVHLAPFALRLSRVLRPLRAWPEPEPFGGSGSRWQRWLDALEVDVHVRATTSADDLYVDTADVLMRRQPGV